MYRTLAMQQMIPFNTRLERNRLLVISKMFTSNPQETSKTEALMNEASSTIMLDKSVDKKSGDQISLTDSSVNLKNKKLIAI